MASRQINWLPRNRFQIGDTAFKCLALGLTDKSSTPDEYLFQKPRWMVERYAALVETLKPQRIFELGIWRGGSSVFFHALANPEKLVAIDLSEERIPAVDHYCREHDCLDALRLHFGVDQANAPALRELVASEFGEEPLDLVIDDASHFLAETRASFNVLFPRLREGGVYVIEDWPWAHADIDASGDPEGWHPDREPLTKLVFEIVLACPSAAGLIEKIEIDRNSATIWRGERDVDWTEFDIRDCCQTRGKGLISAS